MHFLKRATWQIKRSRCHISEFQIQNKVSFSMRSHRHFCRFSLTSFSASLDCSWAALSYYRWGNEPHVVSRFIRRADDRPQRDERPAFLSPYSVWAKTSLFVRAVRAIKIIVRERVRILTRARATLPWVREEPGVSFDVIVSSPSAHYFPPNSMDPLAKRPYCVLIGPQFARRQRRESAGTGDILDLWSIHLPRLGQDKLLLGFLYPQRISIFYFLSLGFLYYATWRLAYIVCKLKFFMKYLILCYMF